MKERIRLSIGFIGVLATLFAVYFTTQIFGDGLNQVQRASLKESTRLVSECYSHLAQAQELNDFASDVLRITLIDSSGNVIFESDEQASAMENHANRSEVKDALDKGAGESLRYSVTLGLVVYYYAIRLPDGNVLRLAKREADLRSIFARTTPYILFIVVIVILASILVSIPMSRIFVQPIQKLTQHLENPEFLEDVNVNYPEIAPFVKEIRKQRRELELTIELLKKEKTVTSRWKDEFTANASHELKTPLTSISGYAEMIEQGMAKPKDIPGFAGRIHKEADRLLAIANDMMMLAKLDERGKNPVNVSEQVDLRTIAESCMNDLTFKAGGKHIHLSLLGDPSALVSGNSRLLYEMLYNLIDNAIRYTEENGLVEIITRQNQVTVKDNGIGIPEESQGRVFERFYRVDKSRSKETGGTGLGLSIVKHIAEVHHAAIELKSKIGVGTEITVTF